MNIKFVRREGNIKAVWKNITWNKGNWSNILFTLKAVGKNIKFVRSEGNIKAVWKNITWNKVNWLQYSLQCWEKYQACKKRILRSIYFVPRYILPHSLDITLILFLQTWYSSQQPLMWRGYCVQFTLFHVIDYHTALILP